MTTLTRVPGVELTQERRFTRRVRRLVGVSVIALGVISALAVLDDAPMWAAGLMVIGWILMPSLLLLSIGNPKLRYGLLVPGTVFPLGVLGMALATTGASVFGWWLIAAGLTVGGGAGIWFWYRWLPVPRQLDEPFGVPRLAIIGVHVALIVAGVATVIAA